MKKLLPILCGYTILCAIVCILFGFFRGEVPEVPVGMEGLYKFLNGLQLCFKALPAIIFTGITIGYAVAFGRNPEGSRKRFSSAMFKRYRHVLIVGLVCVFVLTAANEFGVLFTGMKQSQLRQMPTVLRDYIRTGNDLCDRENFLLARQYAQTVLEVEPENEAAHALLEKIDLMSSYISPDEIVKKHRGGMMAEYTEADAATIYELYTRALLAEKQEDWFAAHYYAETALSLAGGRDINKDALQKISAHAWNVLSAPLTDSVTDDVLIFEKKLEGYTALMRGDNLHAYYVFHTLSQQSHALSIDADVERYLKLAETRLLDECFFIDEQSFINSFESASNVYFSVKYEEPVGDVYTQIVYIKGVTDVADSGGVVQYLRNFSLIDLGKNGKYLGGVFVPYAKLSEISVEDFSDSDKRALGIPLDAKFVPQVLLRSVDRNDENIMQEPVYYRVGYPTDNGPDRLFLPLSFADYLLVADASHGAEHMDITSLFAFSPKAELFGYSREVFSQVLTDRILYPVFLLALIICFATYAWDNRISADSIFKFKWIFTFPLFTVLFYFIDHFFVWVFRLQNYAMLGVSGKLSLLWSAIFYVLIFIIASIVFLSRNDTIERK